MKHLIIALLLMALFSSCKKNYNCHCNTFINYNSGRSGTYASQTIQISQKTTLKQATAICEREASNIDAENLNIFTTNGSAPAFGSAKTNCSVE